ncbi:MAG: hypothetical protein HY567_01560 [Candidatus Kerfeldbacteria bacterium]|nr:hypothetical protein [Candidatus Kerfeldbacteria bacterium]
MRRVFPMLLATVSLLLLGISCKNKFVSVNVNVNASAQGIINTAQGVTKEAAVAEAKALYAIKEGQGMDFSSGPCLSDNLLPDWVADIAHNPRWAIDDLPVNQCPSYRAGTNKHFVELDTAGQLIRAE